MTSESVPPAHSPRELLSTVRDLTRQVRRAQRGTWFPLLVFAAITLAAIPIYRFAPHHLGPCRSGPHGTYACTAITPVALVYWPLALVLAYAAIAVFYVQQSRRRGVGTLIRPYVVAGIVIAVVLAALSVWRAFHPPAPLGGQVLGLAPMRSFYDVATPAVAIGLALLVLARVERSRALVVYSVAYLIVVLVEGSLVIHSRSLWAFLPQLLVRATMLLVGSAAFALTQPTTESRAR